MKDFYYILGLEPTCSLDEIKEAYRKLSKKLHPDLNQGDEYFENRFRDVKEAWETLRDPLKRRIYDEKLSQYNIETKEKDLNSQRQPRGTSRRHATHRAAAQSRRGNSSGRKIRKKGMGVGLSVTFLAIVLVVGIYLANSFTGSKRKIYAPVKDTVAAAPVVHKKYRRHHYKKPVIAARAFKEHAESAKTVALPAPVVKPLAPAPKPEKPATVKKEQLRPMIAKTWPDSSDTHSDYLYTTFVHPNVTGIVPMRRQDRYDSNVIASIPKNARVYVLERGETYYRVFYDHNIGFVPKWSLHQK